MQTLIVWGQEFYARLRRIFWIRFLIDVFARFGRDNGGLLAAGLAFFLILAFVPLLLVGLWLMGHLYVHHPDEALRQIETKIIPQIIPSGAPGPHGGGAASGEVVHLMERAGIASSDGDHAGPTLLRLLHGHGLAGLLGLLTTIWAAVQIFINGSTAMNAAWETKEKRNWFVVRLIALSLLVATGIMLVLSLGATALSSDLSGTRFAQSIPFEKFLFSIGAEVLAVVFSAIMYALIYKFLPAAQVSWKSAFVGGAFGAIAWEIAKKLLALYLLKPNKTLYGDLGGLIVFILWVLYSMTILLLGAEVSALYAREMDDKRAVGLRRVAAFNNRPPLISAVPSNKTRPRSRRSRGAGGRGGPHAKR
jgi:membrane protein